MYASKQAPFLITETNAGAIGGSATNFPAFDGQWRQAAWAFVARGAEMIEYWHWHTTHFGTETYWVGILPARPAARPGVRRAEPAGRGVPHGRVERSSASTPDAEVGLLYSARSKWGLAFQAAFPKAGSGLRRLAGRRRPAVVPPDLRGVLPRHVRRRGRRPHPPRQPARRSGRPRPGPRRAGRGAAGADRARDCWWPATSCWPGCGRTRRPAAISCSVHGPRTGTTRVGRGPRSSPPTWPTPRACATRSSPTSCSRFRSPPESDGFGLSAGAAAVDWSDGLISDGSKIILGYDHPHFGQFPAVVSTEHGDGRITTVGTVPNAALAADLLRWLAPGSTSAWDALPPSVTVRSATNRAASGSTSCTTGAGSRSRSAFPSQCVTC